MYILSSLLIITLLSVPSEALIMLIVYGTPDSSSTVTSQPDLAWDDCVNECFESDTCQVAYRSKDGSKKCYLYDAIQTAAAGDAATGDRIAIKIDPDDNSSCVEDPSEYFKNLVIGSSKSYTIDFADDTYTFATL